MADHEEILISAGLLSILGSIIALGYEILLWLKNGFWPDMDLIWLFLKIAPENSPQQIWLFYPDTWIGLHKIFEYADISISLFLIGMIIFLMGTSLES